ncbi:MAG: transposase [Acidobacteriia bacterium]|nr:transposase [Terriglobia bacterium]
MARPARNASPENILSSARTFFATTKTSQGRALLQSERNATLMIDVLRSYVAARKFCLHDFVVMPDHVHVLLTVGADMTIEKAMQFIKGGFSNRLKKECGYLGDVWQRGFSEVRVENPQSFLKHRDYIAANPVRGACFSLMPQGFCDNRNAGWARQLAAFAEGSAPRAASSVGDWKNVEVR